MTIRFQCKCGQPLQVPDDYSQRVVTCPKCVRSVGIPQPLQVVQERDARLTGMAGLENVKRLEKPIKCTYCGWMVWEDIRDCPKCLRKLERPSPFSTLVSLIFVGLLAVGVWYGYRLVQEKKAADRIGTALDQFATAHVADEAKRINQTQTTDRSYLGRYLGASLAIDREWEVAAEVRDVRILGEVDQNALARLTYRLTVLQVDPSIPEGEPNRKKTVGSATLERKLRFDGQSYQWQVQGEPEVIDKQFP